jgi:hypothetical protein
MEPKDAGKATIMVSTGRIKECDPAVVYAANSWCDRRAIKNLNKVGIRTECYSQGGAPSSTSAHQDMPDLQSNLSLGRKYPERPSAEEKMEIRRFYDFCGGVLHTE